MKFAFCLFKYFPFGGMQKNFLNIAAECHKQGHEIIALCGEWQGDKPEFLQLQQFQAKGLSNHARNKSLAGQFSEYIKQHKFDSVVGFNKMLGLDVYYAADGCFATKSAEKHGRLYTLTPRYRQSIEDEKAVFSKHSNTEILMVSEKQIPNFVQHYQTEKSRFHLLPPGISHDFMAADNAEKIKVEFRQEFNIHDEDYVVLMVGSGFKTKGLDRAVKAVASLPQNIKNRLHFFVVGQDKSKPFTSLIKKSGIEQQIKFMGGRADVKRFFLAADLLIHPAYHENTGNVLLEAMISGLPVLTTDACGYAHYINEANAGKVISSPFAQQNLNQALADMLLSENKRTWKENGIAFGHAGDIYGRAEKAAKIIEQAAKRCS